MYIPFILLACVFFLLLIELINIRRLVKRIPIRVHVNGSRGKSTVTRYIAAGLRAGGKRVAGKITGIEPTILLPDGTKQILQRRGPANVREQLKLARFAVSHSCDALVLECMSIAAALQRIETAMLQPHVTVLLNILEDHLEELGVTDFERTEAYCSALPSNAIIVTNDIDHIWEIESAATARNSRILIPVKGEYQTQNVRLDVIAQEHVGIALTVCKALGIDEQEALQGILNEIQHDESLLYTVPVNDSIVKFINGFAVNDVASAQVFLETWKERLGGWNQLAIVLNTRSDRPRRSIEFAQWCASAEMFRNIIVTGTHIPFTLAMLRRYGVPRQNIHTWGIIQCNDPQASFREQLPEGTVVFGFGNIAGDGFTILHGLQAFKEAKEHPVDY